MGAFDEAFASRIHVPIRYKNLSRESRRVIWRNFCDRVPGGMEITEEDIDQLSRHEINGRQIKNIVKTATLLANKKDAILNIEHIIIVLRAKGIIQRSGSG